MPAQEEEEEEEEMSQSDLLLEASLRGPGGGGSGGRLDRLVGHDARGELLLGLCKAGAGGAVHPVDLRRRRRRVTVPSNKPESRTCC